MWQNTFSNILESIECNFTCNPISSSLFLENTIFDTDSKLDTILDYAVSNSFSQIPLINSSKQQISRIVCVDLANKKITRDDEVKSDDIISSTTPLRILPSLLAKRNYYLVMEDANITKIVTIADINKLPMRTYLYILFDRFDLMITEYIKNKIKNDDWMKYLPETRQEAIVQNHRRNITQNLDTIILECASFADKAIVVESEKLSAIKSSPYESLECCVSYVQAFRKNLSADKNLLGYFNESGEISGNRSGKQLNELSSVITAVHGWIAEMDRILAC